jgi:hypothetical protein
MSWISACSERPWPAASEIARREDRARKARRRLRLLSERSQARIGTKSWSRDDLHER